MSVSTVPRPKLPRLPTLGWATFAAAKETAVPCILDCPEVVYTSSGRAAIALALRHIGVGRGDRVLVPTYHCPTMVAPIVASGATPFFFAIDAAGTPRIDLLATEDLSRVRAMIAAYYFGLPQPMARLRKFCDERNIALIEDCAHAMFGQADGKPVGSWGDYAIASLTKFLPTTEGGCLVFADRPDRPPRLGRRSIAEELRSVANAVEIGAEHEGLPGFNRALGAAFSAVSGLRGVRRGDAAQPQGIGGPLDVSTRSLAEYTPESALWRRATMWSRWIARSAHRQRIVATRRRNYQQLCALFATVPGTRVLQPQLPEMAVPYVFPLWVDEPERSYRQVRAAGVPVFRWDDIWEDVPSIEGDSGPDWSLHVFQIGCHQDLDVDDLEFIANALRRIVSAKSA